MKKRPPSILLSAAPIGLGHLRAAYPIDQATHGKVMIASLLGLEDEKERELWSKLRSRYEFLSRHTEKKFFSHFALKALDLAQEIEPLKKKADLSKPTLQVKILDEMIGEGLGEGVAKRAKHSRLPFVTTFYALSLAADKAGVKKVFCVIPDSQVSRVWVARNPKKSKIIYFVPLKQTVRRLLAYGVPRSHIYLTGFPLPEGNVNKARGDLKRRLMKFSFVIPAKAGIYRNKSYLYRFRIKCGMTGGIRKKSPLKLVFAIGGAGAQTKLAIKTLQAFLEKIRQEEIVFYLVAGVRPKVNHFFEKKIKDLNLTKEKKTGKIKILYEPDLNSYFRRFNKLLRQTDILFTKPSELSFYCALGIPIVTTPAIGPHEKYNLAWLKKIGACLSYKKVMNNFDSCLKKSLFAKAALNGYRKASREGTEKICQLISKIDN